MFVWAVYLTSICRAGTCWLTQQQSSVRRDDLKQLRAPARPKPKSVPAPFHSIAASARLMKVMFGLSQLHHLRLMGRLASSKEPVRVNFS